MNQWNDIANKTQGKLSKASRAIALQMGDRVIKRSPVDTGRFRGNWNSSINSVDYSIDSASAGALNPVVSKLKIGDTFNFTNNLPYAERLEFGAWSDQAPQGMVRITIAEFSQVADAQIKLIARE